jgi:hypothetical protein
MRRSLSKYPIEVSIDKLATSPQIDNEIRGLLIELNNKGLITCFSCSGHGREGEGYIGFDGVLTMDELDEAIEIVKSYGLCEIKTTQPKWKYGITDIRFELPL